MDRTRRRELFWVCLAAGCIGLFVVHHQRDAHAYDRAGMNELVREAQTEPVAPRPMARAQSKDRHDTSSIAALPMTRPASGVVNTGFYVPLGSYKSFDLANRRYLGVARQDPALESTNKLRIETVDIAGQGEFHRVKMGNFRSRTEAQNACDHAGISSSLCLVVASR